MPLPQVDAAVLLALLPAILGLVNFIKSLGAEGKLLTIISMVIGVAFYLCYALLPVGTFQIILNGIVLGLAACGIYDLANMVTAKQAAK
jgi:hypothetical protein